MFQSCFSEYYREFSHPDRPDLAYNAKLPHILPQGGVAGETEYEHRWLRDMRDMRDMRDRTRDT